MLLIATLSLLVASGLGAGMNDTDMMPHMCCMPKAWEATIVDLKAANGLYALQYAHDDDSMREGYYIIPVGADKPTMQVHKDFKDMATYTVNMTAKDPKDYKCYQTRNNDHFYSSCSDKDHTVKNIRYLGDATIGPVDKGIHYDGWAFTTGDVDIVLSLSRDGCVPVMESITTAPGSTPQMDQMLMFTNVYQMVKTKELLTIPAPCVNSASAVIG